MIAPYWMNRVRPPVLENELSHGNRLISLPHLHANSSTGSSEFACVPAALRDAKQWVCWTYGMRNGKPTKLPINPLTGAAASVSNPATWGTFEQAIKGRHSFRGMAGVGFVFAADDPFAGIDLDNCVVDGVVAPQAQAIVNQFTTYTEISPSGAGLKLFLKGKKLTGSGCRVDDIDGFSRVEVYDSGRFFAVTGRSFNGTQHVVEERQAQLDAFCERLWPPATKHSGPASTAHSHRPAPEHKVNCDMSERERRCWRYVEKCPDAISGQGGHNATLRAACECFRFDLDEGAAWRVMQAFNREKTGGEPWTDRELKHKLESAHKHVLEAGEIGCRLHDEVPKVEQPAPQGLAVLMTDVGNARRLVNRYGDRIRFCFGPNKWLIWDGRRWKVDDRGAVVQFCIKTAVAILDEAKKLTGQAHEDLVKWGLISQKRERLAAMAALAQPAVAVAPDELDTDPWAFNCLNGTIDLLTGDLRPHRQTDLITKLARVHYDPDAKCPRFDLFLQEIFGDQPQLILFVQRWHGHGLTADVREQYLVIYHGAGNNGKNVLLDTCSGIMGDYACEAPPDLLTVRRNPEHPTEIADLMGRRLVIASETEKDTDLRVQLVKRLTGNDRLKGRYMRQDYFEFPRTHKLILVTNNRPVIREDTEAIWRRIRLVPFNIVISKEKRDTGLLRNLKFEWPGILAWMVRGCVDWRQHGLPEVEAIADATEDYRNSSNSFDSFADRFCSFGPTLHCATTTLVNTYSGWCQTSGLRALQGKALGKVLRAKRCFDGKINGERCWSGIGLNAPVGRYGQN